MDIVKLGDGFASRFMVCPALTEEMLRKAYFIRHDVYCREFGFEPPNEDEQEIDEFDAYSLQCVMTTADQSTLVGCTRLVFAQEHDLPIEQVCRESLSGSLETISGVHRRGIAEVSRLAVLAPFRRRKGENMKRIPFSASDFARRVADRFRFPYITVGLYLATMSLAKRNGIEAIFILTEQRLFDHFRRLGVTIQAVGSPVKHRGIRVPSVLYTDEVINSLKKMVRPIWVEVNKQIEAAYSEIVLKNGTEDVSQFDEIDAVLDGHVDWFFGTVADNGKTKNFGNII